MWLFTQVFSFDRVVTFVTLIFCGGISIVGGAFSG